MALSNIFREPRREITESVVGIAVVGGILWADYGFARWLQDLAGLDARGNPDFPWPIGMAAGVLAAAAIVALTFLAHNIGQGICDALEERGLHLRPRR